MPSDSSTPHRRTAARRWLIGLCLFAALPHGAYYLLRPDRDLSNDEREYIVLAVNLAETGRLVLPTGDVAKRMPLYPAFLSLIHRTQPADLWQNAALLIQTLLALCSTLLIAVIAYRLADARAAVVAGVSAALYSPFIYLQMSFLGETLMIFLIVAALLLYVSHGLGADPGAETCRTNRTSFLNSGKSFAARQMLALAGCSCLLGLAVLTRANALIFLLPFALDAAIRPGGRQRRFVRVTAVLLPALTMTAAWMLRNRAEIGSPVLSTTGGLNFYLGHHSNYAANPGLDRADYRIFDRLRKDEGLSETEADRALFQRGLAFIKQYPGRTMRDVLTKIRVWFTPLVASFGPSLLVLALVVTVHAGWKPWRTGGLTTYRRHLYVAALMMLPLLVCFWVWKTRDAPLPLITPHYLLPLGLPALLLLRTPQRIAGLFIGLVASQLLVAVAFIPLGRLRWPIDPLLIIAVAVGVANLCRRLRDETPRPERPR